MRRIPVSLLILLLLAACGASPTALPTETVPPPPPTATATATDTPAPSSTPTVTSTPKNTSTRTILPTYTLTPTQVIASELDVSMADLALFFKEQGFRFSAHTVEYGMNTVEGSSNTGGRLRFQELQGKLVYAEANVENLGPYSNTSLFYTLLEAVITDPKELESVEYWLDHDAVEQADASPHLETTFIGWTNLFYTYTYMTPDSGRVFFKIYTLSWVLKMQE